jgi:hypothetical protein
MTLRFATQILAVVITALSVAPAPAAVCQGKSMTLDEIADVIKTAPTCGAGMAIFRDCQLGSSGDLALGAAARETCEADFLAKLPTPQKHVYQREIRACARKYAGESGTMYRSFEAFCSAEVAQRYSQRALRRSR